MVIKKTSAIEIEKKIYTVKKIFWYFAAKFNGL